MDDEYIMYITQDNPPVKDEKATTYRLHSDYVFRVLFCKDVFFEKEQEYRIILPDEVIEDGKSYPVKFSENYEICDLESFF